MLKNPVTKVILQRCEDVSRLLRSLAHPVRIKVLCHVIEGEKTVNELTKICGISQPAMSQCLNRMKSEGLLESRREGNHVYYRVVDPNVHRFLHAIKEIYCD